MNANRCAGALALAAAVLASSFWRPDVSAQSAQPPLNGPQFEVDPSWPTPLPERWVTGDGRRVQRFKPAPGGTAPSAR